MCRAWSAAIPTIRDAPVTFHALIARWQIGCGHDDLLRVYREAGGHVATRVPGFRFARLHACIIRATWLAGAFWARVTPLRECGRSNRFAVRGTKNGFRFGGKNFLAGECPPTASVDRTFLWMKVPARQPAIELDHTGFGLVISL